MRRSLAAWLGGTASFSERARDVRLRPIPLPLPRAEAVTRAVDVVRARPNWHVVGFDSLGGTVHAVHVSVVWRFVDDVKLRFEANGAGCTLRGESRSRFAFLTLGRNTRNLREVGQLLRAQLR